MLHSKMYYSVIFGFREQLCRVGVLLLLKLLQMEFSTGRNYSFLPCMDHIHISSVQTNTFPTVTSIIHFYSRKHSHGIYILLFKQKICIQTTKLYKADQLLWSARNQRELLLQHKCILISDIRLKIVFETCFKRARGAIIFS